jgi:hypothetical protein
MRCDTVTLYNNLAAVWIMDTPTYIDKNFLIRERMMGVKEPWDTQYINI